jgi:hypothetical protein
MRFLAVIAVALAAASVAAAGNPDVQHMRFATVTPYDDFCGTGRPVTETFTADVTVWLDPNQPVQTRNHTESEDVFVAPSTGVTVTTHGAYSFDDVLLSTDPSGVNVHEWTFKGAAQITRVKGDGVIFRDAGHFVVDTTWSGPEFRSDLLDLEVVRDDGGHPDFTSDFCTTMVPALGLG